MSVLGAFLADAGFTVDDKPVRGRTSTWRGVQWIMVHHYGGSEDPAAAPGEAQYVKTASGRYPPLCQLYLDLTSKVWIISKELVGQQAPGRASHAGTGVYPGIERDRGNEVSLGIEVQCSGTHPLAKHGDMYRSLIRLIVALLRYYNLTPDRVIGHKEYNPGKIDPLDNMNTLRADVRALWEAGDEDMPTADEIARALLSARVKLPDGSNLRSSDDNTRSVASLLVNAAQWSKSATVEGRARGRRVTSAIQSSLAEILGRDLTEEELDRIEQRVGSALGDAVVDVDVTITGGPKAS